jgi:histone acetyltransferase MYST1
VSLGIIFCYLAYGNCRYSDMGYNLACILTFPCVQRCGYGRFLMAFSYELSKKEEKAGSPEKPLSDLGAVGYKSYWAHVILRTLREYQGHSISVTDLTRLTSILPEDVLSTLTMLNLVQYVHPDNPSEAESAMDVAPTAEEKGQTDKEREATQCFLYAPIEHLDELLKKYPEGKLPVQAEKLHWAPLYVTDPKKDKWSIRSIVKDAKDAASAAASGVKLEAVAGGGDALVT